MFLITTQQLTLDASYVMELVNTNVLSVRLGMNESDFMEATAHESVHKNRVQRLHEELILAMVFLLTSRQIIRYG